MRRIILASQSPRRVDLLTAMGVPFTAIPSDFSEYLDDDRSPESMAEELGLGKALTVAKKYPDAIVIGSDTIVTIDGRQLGKAEDIDEARAMLKAATEHPNKLTSSLAVICLEEDYQFVGSASSWVYFKSFDGIAVEAYLSTGDYADKAGAYGIQSGAAPLIQRIEGRLDTVIGLPTKMLAEQLRRFGYEAQPVTLPMPE